MLHHDQRIAQIPQVAEGFQQLIIVPLVQADAGLIQDIGHAHQAGADLGGQTDSLGLAAGEGGGGPGKGQVFQPHVHQKSHSCTDFLQNLVPDGLLTGSKL